MNHGRRIGTAAATWLLLGALGATPALADVYISEFMASNGEAVADEDGDFRDWLELYNDGTAPVDLDGWYLTDDPLDIFKWRFPAIELPAKGFLTVFCSEKARSDPAGELHTNFRLDKEGEYLALVDPRGTIAWQFTPQYGRQLLDVSFGYRHEREETVVLPEGATGKVHVPLDGSDGLDWTQLEGFDDSDWTSGPGGFGYDRKSTPTYSDLIQTDIQEAMYRINASAYVRLPFRYDGSPAFDFLVLRMRYEDGFVAYLNGVEIARGKAPPTLAWDSRSGGRQNTTEARTYEEFTVSGLNELLRAGDNLLAIHGMNDSPNSSDFFVQPELATVKLGPFERDRPQYFDRFTPGKPNGTGFDGVSREPQVSVPEGAYANSVTVTLSSPLEGAPIHYTLDGSEPTTDSPVYATPIVIDVTTVLKAKLAEPGLLPSRTVEQSYVILDQSAVDFDSDLPLVIVNTFGRAIPPTSSTTFADCHFHVIERGDNGRTRLTDPPDFSGRGGIRVRGSSTGGRAKASFRFELWDERRQDRDASLLGMPTDSDWILYTAYNFDPALIRNAFMYVLSNEVGRYAVRIRFCEVFLNTSTGPVRRSNYFGVYVLMEKIKRGPERVDIQRITAEDTAEPEISGGYIYKIDRPDPGESGFSAAGQTIRWVTPDERDVRREQRTWVIDYFNDFARALNGANFRDPVNGYARYIDVDSWIDHHILNVLPKNVDAFRLSGYFFKDRNGKIQMGPIWDFDRSMDSTDGRDNATNTWDGTGDATRFFSYPWWNRLFLDPDFMARYRARWNQLRKGPLSTANMHRIIDEMAAEIAEGQVRNFQRWPVARRGGWTGEIQLMKNWLKARAEWIDSQFIEPPGFSAESGDIVPPLELTLTNTNGAGDIYFTLDGEDPRDSVGDDPSPSALRYEGPITVTANTRVRARVWIGGSSWSAIAEGVYVVERLTLAATELMYMPDGGSGLEFVELYNHGDSAISLAGSIFERGVIFDFAEATVDELGPGEFGVLVRDLEAFSAFYDTTEMRILGEYRGSLNDRGEQVVLRGPITEIVFDFSYDDWYPETASGGRSLVLLDPTTDPSTWSEAAAWVPSQELGGSPGRKDGAQLGGGQLPGDGNQDGRLNILDGIYLINFLFAGNVVERLPCGNGEATDPANIQLLDSTGDGTLNPADVILNLRFMFQGGPLPANGVECREIPGCSEICVVSS